MKHRNEGQTPFVTRSARATSLKREDELARKKAKSKIVRSVRITQCSRNTVLHSQKRNSSVVICYYNSKVLVASYCVDRLPLEGTPDAVG